MSRFKIATVFVCLLSAAICFAAPHKRNQPDQTIDTPVGKFTLTKLNTFHMWGILIVEGELVNETSKTWDDVYLAIELTDKNGKVMPKNTPYAAILRADPNASSQLHAHNIAPGARFKIKFDINDVKADGDTLNLVFKYAFGEYPLSYKLALSNLRHPMALPSETRILHWCSLPAKPP